jgi:hypothetical protein
MAAVANIGVLENTSTTWYFISVLRASMSSNYGMVALAALVAEEYNIIITGNRDGGVGERAVRE